MNCIFPNFMVNTIDVHEVFLGLFALQIHNWFITKNKLLQPEYKLPVAFSLEFYTRSCE